MITMGLFFFIIFYYYLCNYFILFFCNLLCILKYKSIVTRDSFHFIRFLSGRLNHIPPHQEFQFSSFGRRSLPRGEYVRASCRLGSVTGADVCHTVGPVDRESRRRSISWIERRLADASARRRAHVVDCCCRWSCVCTLNVVFSRNTLLLLHVFFGFCLRFLCVLVVAPSLLKSL
ncbi:unnamed protein product [Aphis gossypii]|uniref:Uncharacterized protein n=1 Tax=Aphis gossypii TaxID=80765 RepID=A0A9P0J748_APHGO|nr:unnamed protein product [Aphis gossypii]